MRFPEIILFENVSGIFWIIYSFSVSAKIKIIGFGSHGLVGISDDHENERGFRVSHNEIEKVLVPNEAE